MNLILINFVLNLINLVFKNKKTTNLPEILNLSHFFWCLKIYAISHDLLWNFEMS